MTTSQAETILGLKGEYSPSDVKQRYRKLSKLAHPDSNGDEDLFALINEAYEVLKDKSGFVKTKEKPKPKNEEQHKTPTSERDKIISSCERINFSINELCLLSNGKRVEKSFLYKGVTKKIRFSLQDFIMNYYKNIFLVVDIDFKFEEVGFFSKEVWEMTTKSISLPASKNMVISYSPEIKVHGPKKVNVFYTLFENVHTFEISKERDSKVDYKDYGINGTEFGDINMKFIINVRVKRE